MHDVLSNWYRRAILYCLQDRDDPVSVATVARRLVAWDRGLPTSLHPHEDPDSTVPEHLRTWILHAHVMEMAEFGVLTYDPATDTLRLPDDVSISVSPPWERRET